MTNQTETTKSAASSRPALRRRMASVAAGSLMALALAGPAHALTAGFNLTTQPRPTRACTSVQSCNKYISKCVSIGPGWEFNPISVDQFGRPAAGVCTGPSGTHI